MRAQLSADDQRAVLILRDRYLAGESDVDQKELREQLGLEGYQVFPLLKRLQSLGTLHYDVGGMLGGVQITRWIILPAMTTLANEIETPPDRVAEFLALLNRHSATFGLVLLFMALAFFVGLVNELFELWDHVSKRL